MSWPPSNQGYQQPQWQPPPGPPNPGYGQPYAPQQGFIPPPQEYNQKIDSKEEYGERFKPKKKVNDIAFLILFVAQFAGFAVLAGLALKEWVKQGGLGGGFGKVGGKTGNAITLNSATLYLLLVIAGAGFVLATFYLILVRLFTKIIMHATLILSIALSIGICVYYWIIKYYSAAIIFTIFAILFVFSYFGYRRMIPLSSLLLQVTIDVSKHHKSVYVVALIALILQTALSVLFSFVAMATYAKWTPGSPFAGLIFYETFSYIWTSQVIANVALATLAGGPYGAWYYYGPEENGLMPKHPTLSAFGRASTLSLGSIAFGSLIVTLLELLRMLLNAARNSASADGSPVEACLFCCAECFVGLFESLVEYFNRYAYIEIALYGKPYIAAAKDTWRLFRDRGIDALVNDSLVSMTLTWGGYIVGLCCSLFGYLYLRFTEPSYNAGGQYTVPIVLFAFLIGLTCTLTIGSAIDSGVSTIFVGLGEDPQILAERAPGLFAMISEAYPDVVRGVV